MSISTSPKVCYLIPTALSMTPSYIEIPEEQRTPEEASLNKALPFVLRFLSPEELMRIFPVCKTWYHLASASTLWNEKILFNNFTIIDERSQPDNCKLRIKPIALQCYKALHDYHELKGNHTVRVTDLRTLPLIELTDLGKQGLFLFGSKSVQISK